MAKVFQTFIRSKIFFVLYLMCTFWYFYWTHLFAVMALEYCHLSHRLSYCEIFFIYGFGCYKGDTASYANY